MRIPEFKIQAAFSAFIRLIAITGAIIAAGCTSVPVPSLIGSQESQVFAVAIENFVDRYIDDVSPATLSLSGLAQLSEIDDRLGIAHRRDKIVLTYDGDLVMVLPTPDADDVYGWADLTASFLKTARQHSQPLENQSLEDAYEAIFAGFVRSLDKYSRYLSPEAAFRSRAGRDGFGGIGITLEQDDGSTVIRNVLPNNPADKAGLQVEDRITHVNGKTIHGLNLNAVVDLLRGPIEQVLVLRIDRKGLKEPFDRKLVRQHILSTNVFTKIRDDFLELRVTGFNQSTARDLRKAMVGAAHEAEGSLRGIILDLRNNPGGLLDQAISVADLFMTRGRIISTKGRHPESKQIFDATPGDVLHELPMVVLINGRTASSAEIVAVALRDSGRAVMLGTTTFGKGTVQTIIRLPNHGEFNITWARILAPSGQSLNNQGVVPAICTNIPENRLETLVSMLQGKSGVDESSVLSPITLQKRLPHFSRKRRSDCLPGNYAFGRDLHTARLLLGNGAVYSAATAHPAPNIATR
jgi:carboxyl-terminal processing protease